MKCKFEHDGDCCNSGATQYMCKCKKPCNTIMPITNADRIRAMSDEELAESLSKTVVDAMCYSHGAEKSVDKMPKEIWEDLVKEYLEWLKQPAEVE